MQMREWRKSNGLTLQQVAERVQVSYSQIARIETGKSRPSPAVAERIESVSGGKVSAVLLLGLVGANPSAAIRGNKKAFFSEEGMPFEALKEQAAACGLNAGAIMRKALEEAVKTERIRRWNEENREAVESWNELVEREGLWSDGIRAF